jgi:N-acetylglucosaminyl-diphospho-decaprenol L-rhamnosyltransferase
VFRGSTGFFQKVILSPMDLSIIIVNWNSKDYLQKCLVSLFRETHQIAFEVIVIDSASYDGCDQMLQEHFPQVRFIQSDKNVGFARANNAAFRESRGDCVLFLNPDTELVGPAINVLYTELRSRPQAGSVGARLLNFDGSIQTSCIQSFPTILNQVLDSEFLRARSPRSRLWGMAPLHEQPARPQVVEAISGACVMLPRPIFERVGCFSEDYFMYAEDIDLSDKVRRAGAKNYYVPQAVVVHHGGSSVQQAASDFSVVMMREAIWRFLRKTRGGVYGLTYRAAMFLSAASRLLLLKIRPSDESQAASLRKWRAIFRWSLNREKSVRRFYPL